MFGGYLVFKGVEIFQLALTSSREGLSRGIAAGIGALAIIVAVGAVYGFIKMGDEQAASLSRSVERGVSR